MLAIISDIHGNLEALEAVLEECERLGVQRYLCLGDVIGYGPDPLAVSEIAMDRFPICLMGNHEEALITGRHRFNPYAAQAIDWTRQQLEGSGISRFFRKSHHDFMTWYQQRKPFVLHQQMLMVHGSIYDPVHDYVDEPENPLEAEQMIATLERDFAGFDICWAGHNHTPFLATRVGTFIPHNAHRQFRLPQGEKAYVCVGSVGQPRDRDTRASFATLDGEILTFHRLRYDLQKTQDKILRVGLHPFLAERLGEGI
jgi:predicted phosphodiesterase